MPSAAGQTISRRFAVRRGQRLDDRAHLLDEAGEIDLFEIEVHLAGLDLRQIENVVDQAEEMPAGVADLREVGQKFVLPLVLRGLVAASRCSR